MKIIKTIIETIVYPIMGVLVAILLGGIILWACEGSLQAKDWIDIVLTVATITVAVIALYVSHQISEWQKEHNLESVRPFLMVEFNRDENICKTDESTLTITIELKNIGLGPAIMDTFALKQGDNKISFLELGAVLAGKRPYEVVNVADLSVPKKHGLGINKAIILGEYRILVDDVKEFDEVTVNVREVTLSLSYESFHNQSYQVCYSGKELLDSPI